MGAWTFAEPRLRMATGNVLTLRYAGRPERASPAEGHEASHKADQARIIAEALAPITTPAMSKGKKASAAR